MHEIGATRGGGSSAVAIPLGDVSGEYEASKTIE